MTLPEGWFTSQRAKMVEEQLHKRGIRDARVLEAMAKVPRHEFVAEQYRSQAYEDHPIAIGEGQTISQPYIVARMLEALELDSTDVALEIGGGSGYQTALLAELCAHIYSIERHAGLAMGARSILSKLGYENVSISIGDGSLGLADKAPFDAIIVSAAASKIPAALFAQLRMGGRMIIPVGPAQFQELQLIRNHNGHPQVTQLESCRFVPLIWAELDSSSC